MKGHLLPASSLETLEPITTTRPLEECPVANLTLRKLQEWRLERAGLETTEAASASLALYLRLDSWLSGDCLRRLAASTTPAVCRDEAGSSLAWVNLEPGVPSQAEVIQPDSETFQLSFPWDLLRVNELAVPLLVGQTPPQELGALGEGRLRLGRGSRLLPGVYVEGDVLVGDNCKIGPNCYLRGCTSIGDHCHIGQAVEIKNSLILSHTSIGHLSYCGDSILCEGVNFGAGTIVANLRHDGNNHQSLINGALIDTGRRKFGTVVGDGVHTGIHTSIYPGRKLWPNTSTRPGQVIQTDLK